MKIDGLEPIDEKIAFEQGTTFDYRTPYGTITIVSRLAGEENEAFAAEIRKISERHELDKSLNVDDTKEQYRDYVRAYATSVVIQWSTTIKSEGKPVRPTVDNFVDLMTTTPFQKVFRQFTEDCAKLGNFSRKQEEDAGKN